MPSTWLYTPTPLFPPERALSVSFGVSPTNIVQHSHVRTTRPPSRGIRRQFMLPGNDTVNA